MTKEELKNLKAEAAKNAKAEAKEKGLSKEETDKLVAEAVAKVEAENPIENGPKAYKVKTQVPNFLGIIAGVQFAHGEAIVKEGWILEWFREKGYKVEEVK